MSAILLPQPFQKGGVRGDSQGMIALIEHHTRAGTVGLPDMGTGAVIDIHFSGIFAPAEGGGNGGGLQKGGIRGRIAAGEQNDMGAGQVLAVQPDVVSPRDAQGKSIVLAAVAAC